jgi:predicted anti-sigma-YlaC factor YlaD
VSFTPRSVLLIVAIILFLLAAFGVALGTIQLVPLGLAAFAAAFLLDGGAFGLRR